MPEVIVRKGEPVDRALKRLKNKLDAEGILEEVRRLRAFRTRRAAGKPRPTPSAAGRSSASILPKRELFAIRFRKAVADAAAFLFCAFIPRLAKRAEGARKRSIASALLHANTVIGRMIFRGSAHWQLRGPSPSTRLGMTAREDAALINYSHSHTIRKPRSLQE